MAQRRDDSRQCGYALEETPRDGEERKREKKIRDWERMNSSDSIEWMCFVVEENQLKKGGEGV